MQFLSSSSNKPPILPMVNHYGKLSGKRYGNPRGKLYGKLYGKDYTNHGVIHKANYMVKATHKPPARVRYEQSHPTVSFRLSRDVYDLLKQRLEDLGGVSFADFVKDSLGLQQAKIPDIEEIKEKAWNEGYDQAEVDYQIWYYCAVCGERIDMSPNGNDHKATIGYMKEHRWGHASCHPQ